MPVPTKIQFARQVVIEMTDNVNFTSPSPTLAAFGAAATAVQTAYNEALTARQVAKAKTAALAEAEAGLNLLFNQIANYVQSASGGDVAKIESSGFGVANVPAPPIGALAMPSDVVVEPSAASGTMNLDWKRVRGANSYLIERAVDAPVLDWSVAASTTKSKAVVNTMVSGKKYWLRVAAVGAAGRGPWSDAVGKYAT